MLNPDDLVHLTDFGNKELYHSIFGGGGGIPHIPMADCIALYFYLQMHTTKRTAVMKATAEVQRAKQTPPPDQDVPLTISSVAFKEAVPAVVQAATPALFQQLKDSKHPDEELAEHSGVPPKAPHVLQAMPLVNAQLAAGIATDHLMLIEQSIQQQIQDMTGERVKVSRKIYFLACRPSYYPRTKSLTYRTQIC